MWIVVQRLSAVLFTALSLDQIVKIFSTKPEIIESDKIYDTAELAKLLDVDKDVVRALIKKGDIKARGVKGKYKILGQNIKDFLKK